MHVRWSEVRTYLLTLLTLGRVSHLPTVWSNCLAGWWLGGGGGFGNLGLLCLGASFLYLGGAFLNDAFDAEFDRQHRSHRPIPSGAIGVEEVWWWATGWLSGGAIILIFMGGSTGILTLMLLSGIVLYDALNKVLAVSPLLMGACRALLYLVAASTAREGVAGLAIWSGLALGAYVTGLSSLARSEAMKAAANRWLLSLLFVPVALALLVNNGDFRMRGLVLSAVVGLWVIRSLRFCWRRSDPNLKQAAQGLLAGIVLVDLLATAPGPRDLEIVLGFLALFALSRRGQSPLFLL